jgi:hypothetical protein
MQLSSYIFFVISSSLDISFLYHFQVIYVNMECNNFVLAPLHEKKQAPDVETVKLNRYFVSLLESSIWRFCPHLLILHRIYTSWFLHRIWIFTLLWLQIHPAPSFCIGFLLYLFLPDKLICPLPHTPVTLLFSYSYFVLICHCSLEFS